MSPVSVVCPHGKSDCMACGVEFTRLRSQVATLTAELAIARRGEQGALAQARDLALRSAAACNAMEAERDRLKAAVQACGWRYFNGDGIDRCGFCDLTPRDCDSKNRNLSIGQCRGYVARRALAAAPPPTPPTGTPQGRS